jgi:YVTN family beta-propeller protein
MLIAMAFAITQAARAAPPQSTSLATFDGPTYSSPIALDAAKNLIWVVNPDDDSVSVIGDLDTNNPRVIAEFATGDEPQSVALDTGVGSGYRAYVANAAGNSVTILNVSNSSSSSVTATFEKELITGAEPWNVVASPDGRRVFVANSVQDSLTVIDTATRNIVGSVDLRNSTCNDPDRKRHFQPRGLAVTANNDRLYVTRFLSFTGGPTPKQGNDEGKTAVVCLLNIPNNVNTLPTVAGPIALAPQITGFKIDSNGDAVEDDTKAYPNQLQSIVIRGNQAYLPNIAASPSGPLKFNVDTQAFVSVIDNAATGSPVDAGAAKFINTHLGARDPEPGKTKLFFANVWAIAFTSQSGAGNAYVVSAGSDLLVKLNVDASGKLDFTVDANTTRYIDLNDPNNPATSGANAGKNPLGILIRNNKAYTMNYISRSVSVVNLTSDAVERVIKTTDLPAPNTRDEELQVGKEIFFASRGVFNGGQFDRLSFEGWQNCASCHFNGWTDGEIWVFETGPRKSIPLNATFSPHNPNDQRLLNYSAVRDETQDFELNIRNISGAGFLNPPTNNLFNPKQGLLISDTGVLNAAPSVINNFNLPNSGRQQVTVTLPGSNKAWPALDAMNEWIRLAIRTPNGALTSDEVSGGINAQQVREGRVLFFRAGCQSCHGGTKWSNSNRDFTPPPPAGIIATERNPAPPAGVNPIGAQHLFPFLKDIKSFNLGVDATNPIGNNIGAVEKANGGLDALGKDYNGDGKGAGYNIPSLLGIFNLPPYYHNGACETLSCVLSNADHRRSGLRPGQADPLATQANRDKLERWLETLDAETPFPTNLIVRRHDIFVDPPQPFANSQVTVGVNVSLFGTRADLTDLADGATIKVRFVAQGLNSEVDLPLSAFTQDFGQATVTTVWNVPNDAGVKNITVLIDSGDVINEGEEDDNQATRRVRVKAPPPDRTVPLVSDVRISDDNPFNDNDLFTNGRAVKIRFKASDPVSPGGAQTSGLDAFCVVRYSFNVAERRWVEELCEFGPLPAADTGTTDSFTIDAQLPARRGVAYTFIWVRDKAGNISRVPGFDFITFLPGPTVDVPLNRNDVLITRVILNAGQSLTFKVTPSAGDVDLAVFTRDGTRIALSANNGSLPEQVTVSATENNTFIQIETRAFANSVFRIETSSTALASELLRTSSGLLVSPSTVNLSRNSPTAPIIGGPPALQAEISGGGEVYLPFTQR